MNISFQAFHWNSSCKPLSAADFLKLIPNNQNAYNYSNRIIHAIDNGDMWSGLVITVKDAKKFCKIVKSKETIRLQPHQLEDNENVVDFNFFALDKESLYGMYQYYHHSCSLNTFNYIIKKRFNEIRMQMITSEENNLRSNGHDEKKIKSELKKFNGTFSHKIVEREGSILSKISTMDDIKKISIEFETIDSIGNAFAPLSGTINKAKHTLSLSKKSPIKTKIHNVVSFFSQNNIKKGTIEGKDQDGYDIIYKMMNDYDKFATYEYDDLVPSLSLDSSDIKNSITTNEISKRLMEKCKLIFRD
jgi:hypothetical protein